MLLRSGPEDRLRGAQCAEHLSRQVRSLDTPEPTDVSNVFVTRGSWHHCVLVPSDDLTEDDLGRLTVRRENSIADTHVEDESAKHRGYLKHLRGFGRQRLRNAESDLAPTRAPEIADARVLNRNEPTLFEQAGVLAPRPGSDDPHCDLS